MKQLQWMALAIILAMTVTPTLAANDANSWTTAGHGSNNALLLAFDGFDDGSGSDAGDMNGNDSGASADDDDNGTDTMDNGSSGTQSSYGDPNADEGYHTDFDPDRE